MKWHSINKFKPCCSDTYNILIRLQSISIDSYRLMVAHYEDGRWIDVEDYYEVEDEFHKVTHFYIPEPIEIEE